MAISQTDKTAYNLLVDDDGSGIVGTVWEKARVNAIYQAVDGLLSNTSGLTIAGPFFANNGITANGASLIKTGMFTANAGITANVSITLTGDFVASANINSTSGHIFSGGFVTATSGFKERGRSTPIGEWISVPYDVNNFSTAASMT